MSCQPLRKASHRLQIWKIAEDMDWPFTIFVIHLDFGTEQQCDFFKADTACSQFMCLPFVNELFHFLLSCCCVTGNDANHVDTFVPARLLLYFSISQCVVWSCFDMFF